MALRVTPIARVMANSQESYLAEGADTLLLYFSKHHTFEVESKGGKL